LCPGSTIFVDCHIEILRPTKLRKMLEIGTVTNFIKGQRIQWVGHIMRRGGNEPLRAAVEWVTQGKRPRGRYRKRWLDGAEEDLLRLGI